MSTYTRAVKRMTARVLLSGGLAVAGLGAATATAHAYTYGPFQWCPGQELPNDPPRPPDALVWDMGVCHTYYFDYDVRTKAPARYWEGPNLFPTPIPPPRRSMPRTHTVCQLLARPISTSQVCTGSLLCMRSQYSRSISANAAGRVIPRCCSACTVDTCQTAPLRPARARPSITPRNRSRTSVATPQ